MTLRYEIEKVEIMVMPSGCLVEPVMRKNGPLQQIVTIPDYEETDKRHERSNTIEEQTKELDSEILQR